MTVSTNNGAANETSVFESTKDLFETQENDTEKLDFGGVDWNWGDDEKPAATDDGEDSDATAEMTEESDNEVTGNNDGDDDEKPFDFDAEDAKQASPAKEGASDDDAASDANEEEANEEEANAESDEEELEIEAPITNDDDLEEEEEGNVESRETEEDVVKENASTAEDAPDAAADLMGTQEDEPMEMASRKKESKLSSQPDEASLLASTESLFLGTNHNEVTVKDICKALQVEFDCKLSKENKKKVKKHLIDLLQGTVELSTKRKLDEEFEEAQPDEVDEKQEPETQPEKEEEGDSSLETPEETQIEKEEQPDQHSLQTSTDYHFVHADKQSVTVADICKALEAEFGCKLSPANRKFVRKHLVKLMKGKVEPSIQATNEEEEEEDQVSEQGDSESEASEYEEEEEEEEEVERRPQKKASRRKKVTTRKRAPKRPNQRKAAKAARIVTAERLRKRRMEELRIRNEEMQLNQSKEDQERADKIASRFETNTDELRLKRLEDRLDLLQRLDQKRISVVTAVKTEVSTGSKLEETPIAKENEESDDEASSDEEDLEIVGVAKSMKPLKPLPNHMPSRALNILKQLRSPEAKIARKKQLNISPSKRLGARDALLNALKQKQRKVGNRWLARELGYKTEEDHLKDCQSVAEKKREQVIKIEQVRLEANERKLLRERFLNDDENGEDGTRSDEDNEETTPVEEEDEEMQLAKQIEEENANGASLPSDSTGHADTLSLDVEEPEHDEKPSSESAECTTSSQTEESKPVKELDDGMAMEASEGLETQPPNSEVKVRVVHPVSSEEVDSSDLPLSEGTTVADKLMKEKAESEATETLKEGSEEPTTAQDSDDDEEELEFVDDEGGEVNTEKKDPNRPRNAGWQAMLKREAEKLKKQRRKGSGNLVEAEAEEEEEEEVAGLEDFGFSVTKKKKDDDDEENEADNELDEDDLKHVVDDVSDDEGDEEAGKAARKELEQREEKERHKEIIRRMREGYDGRRGGIAGGAGARGMHRFDQLVAADNREDAKRLGLLNDDELDSDDEGNGEKQSDDDEDDEAALLDKMLKDRFLHRSNVDLEENFSEEEEDENEEQKGEPFGSKTQSFCAFSQPVLTRTLPQKKQMTRKKKKKEHKNDLQNDLPNVRGCNAWKNSTPRVKNFLSRDLLTKTSQ